MVLLRVTFEVEVVTLGHGLEALRHGFPLVALIRGKYAVQASAAMGCGVVLLAKRAVSVNVKLKKLGVAHD